MVGVTKIHQVTKTVFQKKMAKIYTIRIRQLLGVGLLDSRLILFIYIN